MKKQIIVISLGGSLIIPKDIDLSFLQEFKKTIIKNSKNHKFIIVCGGGTIARTYINALKKSKISNHIQGLIGISATNLNAKFVNYFFNNNETNPMPDSIQKLQELLKKQKIVICGGFNYKTDSTTDSNAAEIAKHFKTNFINLTNVSGLHDKDPKKHKNTKFISKISWNNFNNLARKIKFSPGQHFILDQKASKIIMKNKIITYILGKNMSNLNNLLKNKTFIGTTIQG